MQALAFSSHRKITQPTSLEDLQASTGLSHPESAPHTLAARTPNANAVITTWAAKNANERASAQFLGPIYFSWRFTAAAFLHVNKRCAPCGANQREQNLCNKSTCPSSAGFAFQNEAPLLKL